VDKNEYAAAMRRGKRFADRAINGAPRGTRLARARNANRTALVASLVAVAVGLGPWVLVGVPTPVRAVGTVVGLAALVVAVRSMAAGSQADQVHTDLATAHMVGVEPSVLTDLVATHADAPAALRESLDEVAAKAAAEAAAERLRRRSE
jgi:hypothetical protein